MSKEKKELKPERFIRIVDLGRNPGDTFNGYQIEMIHVVGSKVISREMVGKPNLFEYAFTNAGDLIDPRNEVPHDAA